ncbi:16S rRNA (cytosine(1402)-N(4))-methyltransferase RsmH [Rubricoccus marinus]|uniref:16S rRNA (cytosine(1402)-N(4))-methyltransferase RsmH n=1 Tax=Rubricoccus marinus TaxID=716817 RepID=UPI000B989C71|nr:16S rRNA (cytosine(1402)-N(4))-methyltransferase RsmH [Rubricoccus marinus]
MSSSRRSRRPRAGGARSADQFGSTTPDLSADPRRSAEAAGASRPDGASGETRASGASAYATGYHDPVLLAETLDLLITDPAGVYIDGTLGGGGHSAALLDALAPEATVIGIDRDPEALSVARQRLAEAEASGRFVPVHATFAEMSRAVREAGVDPGTVSGVLLDLGVSSRQLDSAARGFAFSASGPLDMRMNAASGESAAEMIARLSAERLADVIYQYGEERRSRGIARAIKNAERMETTGDLADAVRASVPTRDEVKTLARVFQGLRIAVNDEMGQIEDALPAALKVLRPGGRLAVIAYHSLEDRPAKRFLRHGSFDAQPEKDHYGNVVSPLAPVTRRAVVASAEEIAANPRARSARLRVAEKTA